MTVSDSTAISGILKYQYSTDGQNWIDITTSNGTVTTIAPTTVKIDKVVPVLTVSFPCTQWRWWCFCIVPIKLVPISGGMMQHEQNIPGRNLILLRLNQ